MSIQKPHIVKRTGILTGVLFFLLLLVGIRLVYIQIKDGKKYTDIALSITEKLDTIYANKGNIYAADGSLLATSMFRYEVRMDVVTIDKKIFKDSLPKLSRKLAAFFGETPAYYENKISQARKNKDRYLFIAKNLNYPDYQKLRAFPIFNLGPNKGGFITIQTTVREHPLGKIAQRTIGYDDYRGSPGIEGAFAAELRGKNGMRLKQKIAKGQWKPIRDFNEIEPKDGKDIITTLDVNMQDVVHQALLKQLREYKAFHGTAVVMEVSTGEIKAIVNLGSSKDSTYYEDRNYAVYEAYEPGSTFKIASMMIALEDKVIDTASIVDTTGKIWRIGGEEVIDSGNKDHGVISMARALEVSSNVGIAKLIYKNYHHQPQKFLEGIKRIGLDKQLGVPIKGEGKPYFPEPGTKKWNSISLPWMSYGYGIHMTPLQVLTFYNAIANNGVMVRPKFVKEVSYHNNKKNAIIYPTEIINPKIASDATLKKLKVVMQNVVKRGTATSLYSTDYSIAGKTGTSQANYWTNNPSYISSFAGFFPYENPKYSCIVVIHIPKQKTYFGASVAGPVFQKIAHKIYAATPHIFEVPNKEFKYIALENNFNNNQFNGSEKMLMPNLIGKPGMDAINILENMGMKVQFHGTGKVLAQSIEAGSSIAKGNIVYLTNK